VIRGWATRSIRTQLTGWYMAAVGIMPDIFLTFASGTRVGGDSSVTWRVVSCVCTLGGIKS
jgi:hypothetical protein